MNHSLWNGILDNFIEANVSLIYQPPREARSLLKCPNRNWKRLTCRKSIPRPFLFWVSITLPLRHCFKSGFFSPILRLQEQQNFQILEFRREFLDFSVKSFHFDGGNLEFPLSLEKNPDFWWKILEFRNFLEFRLPWV